MVLNDTLTLNGIKQDIYFLAKITSSTFQANDLNRIINKYYRILQSDIRGVNEDFFGEIWLGDLKTTYGGTYPNEVPFPDGWEKIKQIQGAYAPANPAAPLESEYQVMNLITQDQITVPGTTFTYATAVIYDNSFFLQQLPTQTITNGLKLFGITVQTDLANDADKPNIFTDYQDAITWGSLIDIAARLGNELLYKKATDMFKQRRTEMKVYAAGRVTDLVGGYVEGQDNEGGWEYPHGHNPMS